MKTPILFITALVVVVAIFMGDTTVSHTAHKFPGSFAVVVSLLIGLAAKKFEDRFLY